MGQRVMIKYGKETHLQDIVKGKLRFAPSQKYIVMERDLHDKGQGDLLEGKMKIKAERVRVHDPVTNELLYILPKCELVVSIENVNDMPVFCLSQYGEKSLREVHGKRCVVVAPKNLDAIKADFKSATHALVIFEPEKFIADVHRIEGHKFVGDKIRYYDYDINSLQMYMFLTTGSEEIQTGVGQSVTYENRYRHLLCKDLDFEQQQEFRFICTDELVTEAVFYPFEFTSAYTIVPIDRLYSPLEIPEGVCDGD